MTGSEDALRKLVARGGDATLASGPMELLLKNLSPGGDLAVMADLAPPRTEVRKVPVNLLDVWPAGKPMWHALCAAPTALGISVQSGDQRRCELWLVCNGDAKAEETRLQVVNLVHAAIEALPSHIAALKDIPPPKKSLLETADEYKRRVDEFRAAFDKYGQVLNDLLAAMRTASCDATDGMVRVQFGWAVPGLLVSAAAADGSPARTVDWLAAARTVDEGNHRGLLSGLLKYAKAQSPPRFPEAAASGVMMLRPETRVSWIAEILPYIGHPDWHVESGYDWNNAHNQPFTKRPLPEVVNPVFGPAASPEGYPVTHYVGVAGVGDDAAQLPADDPPRACLAMAGRRGWRTFLAAAPIRSPSWACRSNAAPGPRAAGRPFARCPASPTSTGPTASAAASPTAWWSGMPTATPVSFRRTSIRTCWSNWRRSTAATRST